MKNILLWNHDMTVCIAAACNFGMEGQLPIIVTAADRMITINELEYEPAQTKSAQLATRTMGMFAGDMQLHAALVPRVIKRLEDEAEDPERIKVQEVAMLYAEEFAFYRRTQAEREILMPIGLDFDRFIRRQNEMAHYQVQRIQDQLTTSAIEASAVIAGLDHTGAHIYRIRDPGVAESYNTPFFACAGSGEWMAQTHFMTAGFDKTWPFVSTLWLAFSAKAKAEVAGGVGRQTDIAFINSDGVIQLSEEEKEFLYELFRENRSQEQVLQLEVENSIQSYIASFSEPAPEPETEVGLAGSIDLKAEEAVPKVIKKQDRKTNKKKRSSSSK